MRASLDPLSPLGNRPSSARIPTRLAKPEEVANWFAAFEEGKFQREAFGGIDGADLHRVEKTDFQAILGPILGASLYSVLHPVRLKSLPSRDDLSSELTWDSEDEEDDFDAKKEYRVHRYHHPASSFPKVEDYLEHSFPDQQYKFAFLWHMMKACAYLVLKIPTIFAILIGVFSVLFCLYFDLVGKISVEVIVPAFIFPISFGITFTITRRERCLLDLASLKSSAVAIYMSAREWTPRRKKADITSKVKGQLQKILHQVGLFLTHREKDVSTVYVEFDSLFDILEELRVADTWINSVISRDYQYMRYMIVDFERLRVVHDFRQPSVFMGFARIGVLLFPILFGPHFAWYSLERMWLGIFSSVFSTILVTSLYEIVFDAEDPFDGLGFDDLDTSYIEEAPLHMWKEERPKTPGAKRRGYYNSI